MFFLQAHSYFFILILHKNVEKLSPQLLWSPWPQLSGSSYPLSTLLFNNVPEESFSPPLSPNWPQAARPAPPVLLDSGGLGPKPFFLFWGLD